MNEIVGNFLPFLFKEKVSKADDKLKNCAKSPILEVTYMKAYFNIITFISLGIIF